MGKIISIVGLFFIICTIPLGVSSCAGVTASVPFADASTIKLYISVTQKTCSEKVNVDWRNLVAIDAVRYEQDFSKVSSSTIKDLCNKFIITDTDTDDYGIEHTSYSLRSLGDVMNKLGFNEDQKDLVQNYLNVGLALSGGSGGTTSVGSVAAKAFIGKVSIGAIETYKTYGVLPSISIAQSILESGWGTSGLTTQANNLFGIKAYNWNGNIISMMTTEYEGGNAIQVMANFRNYNTWEESINDHGLFLYENSRYKKAGVFSTENYVEQAYSLQKAGYATDPSYAMLLIELISQYKLEQYDVQVIN